MSYDCSTPPAGGISIIKHICLWLTGDWCMAVQLDRRWKCMRTGQPYYGEAIAPSNLSFYERIVGQGKVSC